MKVKFIPIYALAALAASSAYATNYNVTPSISGDDYTYTGAANSGDRSTITDFVNGKNLILDSTNNAGTYRSGNITAKKLTAINTNNTETGAGNVGIAGIYANEGIKIDINEASGNFQALSAGNWTQNYTTTTITNSAENSTAVAEVSLNKLTLNSPMIYTNGEPTSAQDTTFKFDSVKANVTVANGTTISSDHSKLFGKKATLAVTNTADVTWNGNMSVVSDGHLDVAGALTLKNNLSLSKDSYVTVGSSGKLEIQGTATFSNKMSNISVASGGVLKATGAVTFNGEMGDISEITYSFIQDTTADIGTNINTALTLGNGANWKAAGKITVDGGHLTLNSGSKYVVAYSNQDGRVILKDGKLTLNEGSTLVHTNKDGAEKNIAIVTYKDSETNELHINGDQSVGKIYVNDSTLDIYMADGVTLAIGDFNVAGNDPEVRIYNFKEDTISAWTTDTNKKAIAQAVALYDADKNFLGNAMLSDSGFITIASIPEPAEWAAIFGAIALGLAIYRRRK